MKKITFALVIFALSFSACMQSQKTDSSTTQKPSPTPKRDMRYADLYYIEEEVADAVTEEDAFYAEPAEKEVVAISYNMKKSMIGSVSRGGMAFEPQPGVPVHNTESYAYTPENEYKSVSNDPLSTFSIDVDAASYTNSRRMINQGYLPPQDAVRIEEFINYFSYDYPQPKNGAPFSINTEFAPCPWNNKHQLLHVGLQGEKIPFSQIKPMNLVFLVDVSGSMSSSNKLPLLKKSLTMLTKQLRDEDRISIAVYAGAAGVVLEPTSNKQDIINALERLEAGGSTAGGEGIKLAYKLAQQNLREDGVNRLIIATDGDFNVGASSDGEMTRLIEEKRNSGIFITALGFGMGNYKDSKMESIADKGNGNYFYIDNLSEARKTLVEELGGTLYTIAKDVKIQIEFNPANVKAYRLIGYVNRKLNNEDFNDDKKDAGELGAGHTVTALYEIIPAGSNEEINKNVDELKYQRPTKQVETISNSNEVALVKLRYKKPKEDKSRLLSKTVKIEDRQVISDNFQFSSAVAAYGMLLSKSKYSNGIDYNDVVKWATASKGEDPEGYKTNFIQLVKMTELIKD